MCKKSLTQRKKIGLIIAAGLGLLITQNYATASGGDKDVDTSSGITTQKKEITLQKAEDESASNVACFNASSLQEASEKEMEIENWMLNPDNSFWQESEINLEKWMYDIHSNFWEKFLNDDTQEYAIEDWMINPSDWTKDTDLLAGVADDSK